VFAASKLRLRSPLSLRLSLESRRALDKVAVSKAAANTALQARKSLFARVRSKTQTPFRSLRVMPLKTLESVGPVVPAPQPQPAGITSGATVEEQVKLVCETAQLLFHCEYIALVEYVECVIPVVYGLYLQALFRLGGDARAYYPQTRDLTVDKLNSTVSNLVVYVWLEVLSLLVLHVVLRRRFNFSVLRQLAFVLETHAMQVQGRMFVWIAFILTFTLEHFGRHFACCGWSTTSKTDFHVYNLFCFRVRLYFSVPMDARGRHLVMRDALSDVLPEVAHGLLEWIS